MALPWYRLALSPNLAATQLRPIVGAWLLPAWASWATVILVLTALCSVCRYSGARRTRLGANLARASARLIGFAPIAVLVQTRYADATTLHKLLADSAAFRAFGRELPYPVGSSPLSSVLGFGLSHQWQLTLDAVGPGLLLLLAAGALMTRGMQPAIPERQNLAGRSIFVATVLLSLFGAPTIAYLLRNSALDAVQRGNYQSARASLGQALRWNPELIQNDDVVNGVSLLSLAENGPSSAAGLVAAAEVYAHANAGVQQLHALAAAHAADPKNGVVRDDLLLAAVRRAFADRDPSELLLLPSDLRNIGVVQYTLGRMYYVRHDDTDARRALVSAANETNNDDLKSSAWTYAAFADARMGNSLAAREDIERALASNGDLRNSQAAAYATGLYEIDH